VNRVLSDKSTRITDAGIEYLKSLSVTAT